MIASNSLSQTKTEGRNFVHGTLLKIEQSVTHLHYALSPFLPALQILLQLSAMPL